MRLRASAGLLLIAIAFGCRAPEQAPGPAPLTTPPQSPAPAAAQAAAAEVEAPPMPRQEDLLKLNERLPESARDILERADEFELMSVAPGATFKPPAGADVISLKRWPGSFRVIGRTRVGDATLRMKILAALYRGMADAEGMAGCFVPRHAIRAGGAGRKVELVICFHCSNVYGSAPGKEIMGFVTDSPQKLFDSVLTSAGVPLK